jgi:hypothetical protein
MKDTRSKPPRLKRGRPPRDYSDDPDLAVAELAIALQAAWDLSERKALDLALVGLSGHPRSALKNSARCQSGTVSRRWCDAADEAALQQSQCGHSP